MSVGILIVHIYVGESLCIHKSMRVYSGVDVRVRDSLCLLTVHIDV